MTNNLIIKYKRHDMVNLRSRRKFHDVIGFYCYYFWQGTQMSITNLNMIFKFHNLLRQVDNVLRNKRPMGHIAQLRNNFQSINTFAQRYDYTITLILRGSSPY